MDMPCPKCRKGFLSVVDARIQKHSGLPRRRRECSACGGRFSTLEEFVSEKRSNRYLSMADHVEVKARRVGLKIALERLEKELMDLDKWKP